MKRFTISALFVVLLGVAWIFSDGARSSAAQNGPAAGGVSGQGKMKFRVLYTGTHLPAEAQKVLTGAHGGFAVDVRPGKGETYFSLKGAGIIQISSDLKTTRLLDTPADMKATNLHNTTIWFGPDATPYLSFPGNEAAEVFTTTLDGKLVNTLHTPEAGTDLGDPAANDYFAGKGNFVPTDVEQLDGLLYVTTGYSNLDFVLTARLSFHPLNAVWHDLAFGGSALMRALASLPFALAVAESRNPVAPVAIEDVAETIATVVDDPTVAGQAATWELMQREPATTGDRKSVV